jgi:hypothetical protein
MVLVKTIMDHLFEQSSGKIEHLIAGVQYNIIAGGFSSRAKIYRASKYLQLSSTALCV